MAGFAGPDVDPFAVCLPDIMRNSKASWRNDALRAVIKSLICLAPAEGDPFAEQVRSMKNVTELSLPRRRPGASEPCTGSRSLTAGHHFRLADRLGATENLRRVARSSHGGPRV